VVGRRATHGVVPDFVAKLRKNASLLEILGDGKQSKSYVDVNDISTAILRIMGSTKNMDPCEVFNVGNRDRTSVIRIAEILCEEVNLRPAFRFARSFQGEGPGREMFARCSCLLRN
jgi:UDP-glucose 4-epimerase